jgi:hypothetical protein
MAPSSGQRDAPSQVGTIGAMRARDVSRPQAADLADAEEQLTVSYRPGAASSSRRGGSAPVSS